MFYPLIILLSLDFLDEIFDCTADISEEISDLAADILDDNFDLAAETSSEICDLAADISDDRADSSVFILSKILEDSVKLLDMMADFLEEIADDFSDSVGIFSISFSLATLKIIGLLFTHFILYK